jgi:membrane protein involved in colicin uptake
MSRWAEEEKIVSGTSSVPRIANLANLVVNALLPEAKRRQAADLKKQAEEQAIAEKKAKDEAEEQAKIDAEAAELAKQQAAEEAASKEKEVEQATAENAGMTEGSEHPVVEMDVDEGIYQTAEPP